MRSHRCAVDVERHLDDGGAVTTRVGLERKPYFHPTNVFSTVGRGSFDLVEEQIDQPRVDVATVRRLDGGVSGGGHDQPVIADSGSETGRCTSTGQRE